MKAIVVTNRTTGKLELVDRPPPQPGAGEVVVMVHAAGVNPVDWKMRSGVLGRLLAGMMPEVPGLDVAGVVEAVGPGGDGSLKPGMQILGMTRRGGGFAELALVQQSAAVVKPDGLSFADAAAIPVAGLTALQALRNVAKLATGQGLLVNGAAGGVGTFAVQLGHMLGAHVTAVTSARNAEMVTALGAERVIDYAHDDFTRLAGEYEVIFDAVANQTFSACAPRLAPGGTYITTLPGLSNLAWSVLTRIGLGSGKHAAMANVTPSAADLAYLAGLAVEGKVKPMVERVLPLSEAAEAFAMSRAGHVRGKLVLSIAP